MTCLIQVEEKVVLDLEDISRISPADSRYKVYLKSQTHANADGIHSAYQIVSEEAFKTILASGYVNLLK